MRKYFLDMGNSNENVENSGAKMGRKRVRRMGFEQEPIGDNNTQLVGRSLVGNSKNFMNSGTPQRILFYYNGEWTDFEGDILHKLINSFTRRQPVIDVFVRGSYYTVDFLKMIMIETNAQTKHLVGWIDKANKCFFPECTVENDWNEAAEEFHISSNIAVNPIPEVSNPSESTDENVKIKEVIIENGVHLNVDLGLDQFSHNLFKLKRGGIHYSSVLNIFLKGMDMFLGPSSVLAIHQYQPMSKLQQERNELFKLTRQKIQRTRGSANVRQAWYGLSREEMIETLVYGFTRRFLKEGPYGVGLYFSPDECSHLRISFSSNDQDGMHYMTLCEVILGNIEQIPLGSMQTEPTKDEFDSGTDDINDPSHYIIWSKDMECSIRVKYIVSLCIPLPIRVYFPQRLHKQNSVNEETSGNATGNRQDKNVDESIDSQKPVKRTYSPWRLRTTSIWAPLSLILTAIHNNISPLLREKLRRFTETTVGQMSTVEFANRVWKMAGDELTQEIMHKMKYHKEPTLMTQEEEEEEEGGGGGGEEEEEEEEEEEVEVEDDKHEK